MRTAVLAALTVLAFATEAPAQDQSAATEAAVAFAERQADVWLASLAAQLQPTADQTAALAAYGTAIRAQAELRAGHRTSVLFVDTAKLPPAPEALAADVQRLRERTDALAAVQAAAAEVYALLTPQQRTVFDFLATTASGTGSAEAY
ncbi:MAG: Spy/CpxP family protein refolding chaperone [Geminicoccaceae bacterium]